jgi:vancomycin resistance protein VanJ
MRRAYRTPVKPSAGISLLSPLWTLLYLLLIWAGKRFVGERWWLTTWLVYLPQLLFLVPILVAAGLAFLLRRWRTLVGQAAVALLCVWLLFSGGYRLPSLAQRGDLRVMSWNVMGLEGNPHGVLSQIQHAVPDVVLLQEVRRVRGSDPVTWLTRRLPGWHAVRGGDVAILSPHPLALPHRILLETPSLGRVALETSVRIRNQPVEVVTVHFNTGVSRPSHERAWNHPRRSMIEGAAVRKEQADNLSHLVRSLGRPIIVGGDFNSPPDTYACSRMAEQLQSAFTAAGSGFGWSFPSNHPLLRIDHLFASSELRILDCRVLPTSASDHCPLVTDLALEHTRA